MTRILTRASLSVLPLALALVAGCASRRFPYPEAPLVSEEHVDALVAMAEDEFLCVEEDLSLVPRTSRLFTVEGCGRASDYLLLCAHGHCRFREIGSLRARAAFDLACEEPIEAAHLGGNAWGVEGCSRRLTYVAACGAAAACAWVPASAMPLVDAVEGVAPPPPTEASALPPSAEALHATTAEEGPEG